MPKRSPRFALALLVTLAIGFTHSARSNETQGPRPGNEGVREVKVDQKAFSIGGKLPGWVEPHSVPPTAFTDPAVVRLADTQFLVADTPVVYIRKAFQANDPSTLNPLGQIQLDFAPEYQKLTLLAVRVLRGTETIDRTHSSTIRFLQRETGLDMGIYSGTVTALMVVNDLRVGDTLDMEYLIEGRNPVFAGRFDDFASWELPMPVEHRWVSVKHPGNRKINWQFLGGNADPVTVQRQASGDQVRLSFEQRQIKAVNLLGDAPADVFQVRTLQLSEYKSWPQVANWARDLFPKPKIDGELKLLIERLAREPDEERRLMAALQFVQSEIRYFAILLGDSSHRPTEPAEVLKRRYGDCKDKSYLLTTLLQALGITARPTLVSIEGGRQTAQFLPSPLAFNHVIVQATVNNRVYYLDPTRTGQYGKLDAAGQAHGGSQVLVAGDTAQGLSEIPLPKSQAYFSDRSESVELANFDQAAIFKLQQNWSGLRAEAFRAAFAQMTREQINTAFASIIQKRYSGARLEGDVILADDRENNILSSRATFTIPRFAEQDGDRWYVRYQPSNFAGIFATPTGSDRKVPVHVPGHPARERYVFEVKFPESVSMQLDPEQRNARSPFFDLTAAFGFRGNRARLALTMETYKDRIQPSEIPDFESHFKSAGKLATGILSVPKQAPKTQENSASPSRTLADKLLFQNRQRIETLDKTISANRLSGDDLASAYCERAIAHSELNASANALKDAAEAARIAPNAPEIVQCVGEVQFSAGQFLKSVGAYSRALTLGGTASTIHYRRGISKYYQDQFAAAAADLRKAVTSQDQMEAMYAALWLTWTSHRAKMPVPEPVRQMAAAKPDGEWPRPALAMLNGLTSPDAVETHLNLLTGDEATMTRSEGYFYLGQHFLSQGNTGKAKAYFEKCLAQGVINYIENTGARFELVRLKGINSQ